MAEYLLEIRSHDMPPRLVRDALRQLGVRLFEELMGAGLTPREILTGGTLRRLTVVLRGLPEEEPERSERELGPLRAAAFDAAGEPTEVLTDFARRVDLPVEALEVAKTEKGETMVAVRKRPGRATGVWLQQRLPGLLQGIGWGRAPISGAPRSVRPAPLNKGLRWGEEKVGEGGHWIRPLVGILSLYDGQALDFAFDGCHADDKTSGHPLLSPEPFAVTGVEHYLSEIEQRGIVLDFEARRASLQRRCDRLAEQRDAEWCADAEVLDRMVWSCEIPGVVESVLEPEHLALPREVIEACLRLGMGLVLHQNGKLLPAFLTVMDRPDDPAGKVARGHQRAMHSSLSDGRFYWDADRREPLAARLAELDALPFHQDLGSYGDKIRRLQVLVEVLHGVLPDLPDSLDLTTAREAVTLLKTDLTTEMVHHHPSLRGVIGGIYAREEGSIEEVWQAIYDQYLPRGNSDPIPRRPLAQLVAVADRLDTLVGLIAKRGLPGGRQDPFDLRATALGFLRILSEAELDLDIDLIAARAALSYGDLLPREASDVLADLRSLLDDRSRYLLGRRGYAHDEIAAAMAVPSKSLPDLFARVAALKRGREDEDFRPLVLASKRLYKMVKDSAEFQMRPELLVEEAEKDLYSAYVDVRDAVAAAAAERRFDDCLVEMKRLISPLERFFNEVLVLAEDEGLRDNRIALLQAVRRVFLRVGGIKEMVVDRE